VTELSDDQAREVLWASSDEGKTQLRAAWDRAVRLGLDASPAGHLTMADVGALLWAAHEAAAGEAAPRGRPRHDASRREFRRILFAHAKAGTAYTVQSLRSELTAAGFLRPAETVQGWLAEDGPELEALGIRLPPPAGQDPSPVLPPAPAGYRYCMLVLSGCVHCHELICRAAEADPWRALPKEDRRILSLPAATACQASPDGLHHGPADTEVPG
jgi:hypothetical protein